MGGANGQPYGKTGNEAGSGDVPIYPTGAPTNPGQSNPITTPSVSYGQNYSAPNFSLTPQSGYQNLSQQIMQSMMLSPQSYAAPRTSLLPMYASPWGVIPGMNAQQQTLGQMWGQNPAQGTAPPPGTPGYLGQNTNTPLPGPPQQTPPTPPAPGQSNPSAPYTPPPQTVPNTPSQPTNRPPIGGAKMGTGTYALDPAQRDAGIGYKQQLRNAGMDIGKANQGSSALTPDGNGGFYTPDPGANYGQTAPGFMNSFGNAGGDVGRYGAMAAMMATRQNEMARQPQALTHEQIIANMRKGGTPPQGPGYLPTTPISLFKS